jgi:hypothetical protein
LSGGHHLKPEILNGIFDLRPVLLMAISLIAGPILLLLPPKNRVRRMVAIKIIKFVTRKHRAEGQQKHNEPAKSSINGYRAA